MPFIKVEATAMTKEQKEKLIADITRVASQDMGVDEKAFYVLIAEHAADNWGIGGKPLSQILHERK